MAGDGGEPLGADGVGDLADAIAESFGSYAGFRSQLTKAAATTQSSGWGILAYEPVSDKLIVEQLYDHQGNVDQGSVPILVFDAWEHAFYLQYKNQKVEFIEAMWAIVNWQDVAKRRAAAKERADMLLLAPDGRRMYVLPRDRLLNPVGQADEGQALETAPWSGE